MREERSRLIKAEAESGAAERNVRDRAGRARRRLPMTTKAGAGHDTMTTNRMPSEIGAAARGFATLAAAAPAP